MFYFIPRFFCLVLLISLVQYSSIDSKENVLRYKALTTNSHASEGGLARINKNKIIVIYRKDTSFAYVSNNGKIVSKTSTDNGKTWGDEVGVYNSSLDDRNLVVGNLSNGNIIVVFRRFDAVKNNTIDSGYIISNDGGTSWTEYLKIKGTENKSHQPFGVITKNKNNDSFLICFKGGLVKNYSS